MQTKRVPRLAVERSGGDERISVRVSKKAFIEQSLLLTKISYTNHMYILYSRSFHERLDSILANLTEIPEE